MTKKIKRICYVRSLRYLNELMKDGLDVKMHYENISENDGKIQSFNIER